MKPNRQQLILTVTAVGMEICCLYALASLLDQQVAGGTISPGWLLLLYPFGMGLNYFIKRIPMKKYWAGFIYWIAWIPLLLLSVKFQIFNTLPFSDTAWLLALPIAIKDIIYTFRPELAVLVLAGLFWFFGGRMSKIRLNFSLVVSEFQFSLAFLVVLFLITGVLKIQTGQELPLVLTFFSFGLIGISLAHARESNGWLSGLHQGNWYTLLIISTILILGSGLVIALLINPGFIQMILNFFGWVWSMIEKALVWFANLFPTQGSSPNVPPEVLPPAAPPDESVPFSIPDLLDRILRIFYIVVVIGAVLLAVWRISSMILGWLARKMNNKDGEYEQIHGAFKHDFLSLLKYLLVRLKNVLTIFRGRPVQPVAPETLSVRNIYRQFLKWSAASGHPRFPDQTPFEYQLSLIPVFPEKQTEVKMITEQYVNTRYGDTLPTPENIATMKENWLKLKQNKSSSRKARNRTL